MNLLHRSVIHTAIALSLASAVPAWAQASAYDEVLATARAGRGAQALVAADQFLAGRPNDPQMRFVKGIVLSDLGRLPEAIAVFTQLTLDHPDMPEPYNNLAVAHAALGQYDKARVALEGAIRTNASYATAYENLGDIYAKLASQAYSQALQLDGASTGTAPKLAMIRGVFEPGARPARPAAPPASVAQVARAPVAAAPAVPAAPAPTPAPQPAPAAAAPTAPPLAQSAAAARPAEPVKPAAPASDAADTQAQAAVETQVKAWAAAWAARDVPAYLATYAPDFETPRGVTRAAWAKTRQDRITEKSRITVEVQKLSVSIKGDTATARFRQAYSADSLNVNSNKTLTLRKSGGQWLIVRESVGG